jgi:hypothetical protein
VREIGSTEQDATVVSGHSIKFLHLAVATIVAVIAIAGVGLGLFHQTEEVGNKIGVLQKSIDDLKARVDRLNVVMSGTSSGTVALLREQTEVAQRLARIEAAVAQKSPPANAVLMLAPSETNAVRAYFKLTRKTSEPPRYRSGEKISGADLKPMPDDVTASIAPELKGTNFVIDQNGALVVTAGPENIVTLIVEPTP